MTVWAFILVASAHLAAAISPGPAFVVGVRTAAAEGFRTASFLALGFGIGAAVWAGAALLGLALLFEVAPWLLAALKIGGGLVLILIAIRTWLHASDPMPDPATALPRRPAAAVRLGLATQLANPKPAVFFGAVFVGLIPPDASPAALALLLAVILADETLWYVFVARVFSSVRARGAYGRFKKWTDRALGTLIAGFGVRIATA